MSHHIRDSCRNLANWIQTMSHSELERCQSPNASESDGEEIEIGSVIVVQTDDGMKVIHCAPKTVHVSESDEEEWEIGSVRIVETDAGMQVTHYAPKIDGRDEDEVEKVSLVKGGITIAHTIREPEEGITMAPAMRRMAGTSDSEVRLIYKLFPIPNAYIMQTGSDADDLEVFLKISLFSFLS